ncbi:MAG: cbb3-type cytochrome c oxidase subunit 3 [Magnetococcus sp. WYHC-3]
MEYARIVAFTKEFALVWFFLFFVGVIVWAYWPANKKRFEDAGRSLFDEDDAPPPDRPASGR